ncbi:MAG: glycoside hydrolase [Armatimonadota bacterium]
MIRLIPLMLLILFSNACSANILKNSSFEENDGKTAVFFKCDNTGSMLDSSIAHSGKWSMRVNGDSSFTSDALNLGDVRDTARRVAVSAWVKAEHLIPGNQGWKSGRMMLWVRDKDGKAIKIKGSSNDGLIGDFAAGFAGTFEWKQFNGNLVLPPGTADVTFQAALSQASGTAWIDDITIDEIPLEWNPLEDTSARISIDTSALSRTPVLGVGWNWEFVWGPPYEMMMPDEIVQQLLSYAKWDEQSFIRFGYVSQYLMKDDLRISLPEFDASSEYSIFYKKLLTGLKELNIPLLACNWFYGDMSGGYKDPPYPANRFVASAAEVIKHWIKDDGFTNIRYASLWNEPCWSYPGKYPDDFFNYTREFDRRLEDFGVRDQVKVMGSDSTESGAAAEFRFPRYNRILGDVVDAFAFHDYGSDIEAPGRVTSGGTLQPYLASYKAASEMLGDKPLFMSEFGTGAFGDEATYRGTLANAELVLGGLNNGVTAFARWNYNGLWDTTIGYAPFLVDGTKLQPHRSVYYPYSILTKAIRPGARVAGCDISGGDDSAGYRRVHATALIGADKSFALVIVNDGNTSKTVRVTGLPARKLNHYWYGADLPDGLVKGRTLKSGASEITIPPMSMNAFVSWHWKKLKP